MDLEGLADLCCVSACRRVYPVGPMNPDPLPIAVLISGSGRSMENLQRAIDRGTVHARIVTVISSRADAYGLERASNLGLKTEVVEKKAHKGPSELSDVVFGRLRRAGAEVIVLAGYMNLLVIPEDYSGRVVNIHPALLPSFGGQGMYGHRVHEAVIARGCKVSGCTVHFADNEYDTGPIVHQRTCPVREGDTPDTLAARVFDQELQAYPEALAAIAAGRVLIAGQRTRIVPPLGDEPAAAARAFAEFAQRNVAKRRTGRPLNEHTDAVAAHLTAAGVTDPQTLAAAHLHDVVEDTAAELFHIQRAFGPGIASLVEELTVPPEAAAESGAKAAAIEQKAAEMSAPAKLIKLADRLDNLLDLPDRPASEQREKAAASSRLLAALEPIPPAGTGLAEHIRALINPYLTC